MTWLAKHSFKIVSTLVAVFCIYLVGDAVYISQTTGILDLTASGKNVLLSIDQINHRLVSVGTGHARIHLKPGSYQVIGSQNKTQVIQTVTIYKKQTTKQTVSLMAAAAKKQVPKDVLQANSLIQLLPYSSPQQHYSISYTYSVSGSYAQPTIIISASNKAAQRSALAWIKSVGFDPSNLTIKYTKLSDTPSTTGDSE